MSIRWYSGYSAVSSVLIIAVVSVFLMVASCSHTDKPEQFIGKQFPAADALFRQDPQWLGADAAITVPLNADCTLWLFGDTFVAKSSANVRTDSEMIRNSVAIQTGMDPLRAVMDFSWRTDAEFTPASFFPENGTSWYWPGNGIRITGGPLLVFLYILSNSDEGLGFSIDGYALAVINNPDDPADDWNVTITDQPALPFDAIPANALVREGNWIIAVAPAWHQKLRHGGALVRYPADEISTGDCTGAQWWLGESRGWVATSAIGADKPVYVIYDAGPECSVHYNAARGLYVHVASYGFGGTDIGIRTAPAITGPWTQKIIVYRPPESDAENPFVYAGKAHPELFGPAAEDLLVTYAANSFTFSDLFTAEGQQNLYWPRFVRVRIPWPE
jgi:hypothetical protein